MKKKHYETYHKYTQKGKNISTQVAHFLALLCYGYFNVFLSIHDMIKVAHVILNHGAVTQGINPIYLGFWVPGK